MLIHCDPKRAQRESCSELPATEVKEHGLRSAQRPLQLVVQSGPRQKETLVPIYRHVTNTCLSVYLTSRSRLESSKILIYVFIYRGRRELTGCIKPPEPKRKHLLANQQTFNNKEET